MCVTLFSPDDLSNPEVQKVAHEVYEWQRQRRLEEDQRVAARVLFEHEPQNFLWCEGYTRKINKFFTRKNAHAFHEELCRRKAEGARDYFYGIVSLGQDLEDAARAGDSSASDRLSAIRHDRTDPVSGELVMYFVPSIYVNEDGGCDQWKERG